MLKSSIRKRFILLLTFVKIADIYAILAMPSHRTLRFFFKEIPDVTPAGSVHLIIADVDQQIFRLKFGD